MDKVTLFEQSLHIIGDREYKRDSPTGRECDLWFPAVLSEALNFGAWSFATRRRILDASSSGVYPLPEDCLRPLKINHSSFELIGRDIHLHVTYQPVPDQGLELTYITNALARAEALPDSQPLFLRGLSLLLAARMAPKITGQPQLAFTLEEAANSALAEALHMDALSQHSNDQHPLEHILGLSIVG